MPALVKSLAQGHGLGDSHPRSRAGTEPAQVAVQRSRGRQELQAVTSGNSTVLLHLPAFSECG